MVEVRFPSLVAFLVTAGASLAACSSQPTSSASSSAEDLSAATNGAKDLTLADVQRAIRAKGASWTAGETALSALPRESRTRMLGVPLSSLSAEHITIVDDGQQSPEAAALPATKDWRSTNGKNYVSPVLDQGRCGSCVGFSTVATFETQLNIASTDTNSLWELSPQYLFSCGGGSCDNGWEVGSAASFMVKKGTPDNSCMPYASGPLGVDAKCSSACSNASTRAVKAKSFTTPTSGAQSVTAVKTALMKGPLVATMTVYDDFMYYTSGVYKHVAGGVGGGHAVSIIGWNNADQAWIVRNSWGTSFGEDGFFEIAWSDTESGVGEETWGFTVPTLGPYVGLTGVRDTSVLSGNAVAIPFDASTGVTQLSWTLSKGSTVVASGTAATLDTTQVADGVYTLQAHGLNGTKKIDGEAHTVSILNGAETGAIKFATLSAGQTLKAEALFNITVAAAPVPLTEVTWTVTDSHGAVVITHSTVTTGTTMQLYWNTALFPNGAYTVNVMGVAGTRSIPTATISIKVAN